MSQTEVNGITISTFTMHVPLNTLRDRQVEAIDDMVSRLRDIPGVVVTGWCDDLDTPGLPIDAETAR